MSSINRARRGELITVGIALQIYDKKFTLTKKIFENAQENNLDFVLQIQI